MDFKVYNALPAEAVKIRETVFVQEQGFYEEFDTTDQSASHLVCYEQNLPIGTCRYFKGKEDGHYMVGRIAVLKQYRGKQIGSFLLNAAEQEIEKAGGKRILLHSQEQAKEFYKKQGYQEYGETDSEQGCPHIWMYKNL
ncbi:GNAT family N-acetyltransferase [bacterium D16-51]|nr:GNAT family N-acetyltransferase [bacterium D16-59]RKI62862.1 GNAT family N-acetyltransferase [bacterium D16-51]